MVHDLKKCSVLWNKLQIKGVPEGDGIVVVSPVDSQNNTVTYSGDGEADCFNVKPKTGKKVSIKILANQHDLIAKFNFSIKTGLVGSLEIVHYNGEDSRILVSTSEAMLENYPEESMGQEVHEIEYIFNCIGA
jgi:hypothetical protein